MNPSYPHLAQILRVSLPALLLAQFVIWPIIGFSFPHIGIIAAETTLLWFMALYIRRHNLSTENLLLLNATPMTTLLLTIPVAICCSLFIAEIDLYLADLLSILQWDMPLSFQKNLLEIQIIDGLANVPGGLAALILAPALCEELFFRGFVLTGLYAHYGPRWALGGSSLLFAISHLNPWQFLSLLLFGLFLGTLIYWTHSIYPAILAHAINNLVSVAGINLHTYLGIDGLGLTQHLPIPLVLFAVITLAFGLLLIRRQPAIMPLLISRPDPPHKDLPFALPPSLN